jgi:hypothetical protein
MNFARLVLLNTVKKELRYEDSLTKSLVYLNEFIRKHGLIQQTSDSTGKIRLYKSTPPYKLQIEFPPRPPKPLPKKPDENEMLEESEQITNDTVSQFYITIQKNPEENLQIECLSYNTMIWMHYTKFTKDIPENIYKLFQRCEGLCNYNALSEELQMAFVEMVREIGVTDDMGKFIELMSLVQEREMYKRWLSKIHNFLEDQ